MMSGRESETECEFEDVDSDSETWKAPSKPKKRRVLEKFRAELYAVKFPVVRKSTVSDTHAYCVICTFFPIN